MSSVLGIPMSLLGSSISQNFLRILSTASVSIAWKLIRLFPKASPSFGIIPAIIHPKTVFCITGSAFTVRLPGKRIFWKNSTPNNKSTEFGT